MPENLNSNNFNENENRNENANSNENIIEEIPLIISKKEEPLKLISSNGQNEQNSFMSNNRNHVYRWSADEETSFKAKGKKNAKKQKKSIGLRIFAAVMSLMFLVSASATGYLIIEQINNANYQTPVLSNKDALEETKNNSGGINDALEETAITIPDNANANAKILTTEEAIAKLNPSVVCIQTEAEVNYNGYFGRNSQPYTVEGVGTGFIVSDDGYIATNYHVVEGASKVTVTLYSGETYEASFIGGDEAADLAVLKIDAKNLPVAELGDSDSLVIGNEVVAIGTPAGMEFGWTATKGIVSAVARDVDVSTRKTMTVIQTDASINPGNSGGPLINMKGQVIGINSMKLASSQYEGMGFAIPINLAIPVLNNIIANPGVITEDPGSTDTSSVSFGIQGNTVYDEITGAPQGWKISIINEGGPCDNSGLQLSDIIIALDGTEVTTTEDLYELKMNYKPGDKVTVTILRNGDIYDFVITLTAREQQ